MQAAAPLLNAPTDSLALVHTATCKGKHLLTIDTLIPMRIALI